MKLPSQSPDVTIELLPPSANPGLLVVVVGWPSHPGSLQLIAGPCCAPKRQNTRPRPRPNAGEREREPSVVILPTTMPCSRGRVPGSQR